jgi:hypothetical protein
MSKNQEVKKEEVALEVTETAEQSVADADLADVSGGVTISGKVTRTTSVEGSITL